MKTLLRILLVLLLILCIAGVTAIIKYPFFNPVYRHKYSDEKYEILIENLKNKGAISTSERKSEIVTNFSEIYPYWLGTRWNFNGISQVPGVGGYAGIQPRIRGAQPGIRGAQFTNVLKHHCAPYQQAKVPIKLSTSSDISLNSSSEMVSFSVILLLPAL